MDVVTHVLAQDEGMAERAEIGLEISDEPSGLRVGQREHQVAELYNSTLHMIDIRVGMLFRL